jgi:hypothetical protein
VGAQVNKSTTPVSGSLTVNWLNPIVAVRRAKAALSSGCETHPAAVAPAGSNRLPEDSFDFLGYTIGRCWSPRTGQAYLGVRPSRESIQRVCRETSERTDRRTLLLDPDQQTARLNRILVGWANYFCLGAVSKAYRSVDLHVKARLGQWLRRKHKLRTRGFARCPESYLYGELGLVHLSERRRHLGARRRRAWQPLTRRFYAASHSRSRPSA